MSVCVRIYPPLVNENLSDWTPTGGYCGRLVLCKRQTRPEVLGCSIMAAGKHTFRGCYTQVAPVATVGG